MGILGWELVKRSRRLLWQVLSTCFCVWVCGGGEGCLTGLLTGEWRKGPALSSLGTAEGNQSISQAILSPVHPRGPLEKAGLAPCPPASSWAEEAKLTTQ